MKLKIMTFNIRISAADDGKNSFKYRKPLVLEVISQHAPHLIGFQEVTDESLAFLRENISKTYEIIACGREKTLRGESVALAYKRDSFVPLKSETFWLSHTPDVFGSTYGGDQSSCPRITTYAVLKPEDYAHPILFANTHFDHRGNDAKCLSAEQMRSFFEACKFPIFFTGDFNSLPDSRPIEILEGKLTNLTKAVGGTFHYYGRENYTPVQIDYIFTSEKCLPSTAEVIRLNTDGVYPSDHYPVVATVEI